ncbi:hypothetical protein GF373_03200 [bacterium]|nr:hypothetical protein [bacterium]
MQPTTTFHFQGAEPSIGIIIFIIIGLFIALITAAITIFVWWRILSRMGFPGLLSLLMIIPIVNFILPIVFAIVEWPIEKELNEYRARANQNQPGQHDPSQQPPMGG